METSLLTTKLNIPLVRPQLVQRPRLTKRLSEGLNYPLVLVSATAGFGKTTLLLEWIHQSQPTTNVAWLSLEEADNDPIRFWDYFIAALGTIHPQIGDTAQQILHSPQPFPVESTLIPLINDLTSVSEDLFFILDDYHFIQSKPIHDGITFLLEHLPSKIHLIIATRIDPPLPLARLRGKGTILEIRTDDLRFTLDEAESLLSELDSPALSSGDIEALNTKAEGWVVGLKMAAFSMRGEKDIPGFISNFTGSQRYIIDFLIEEVLQRQSPETQDFLIQTSVLERLSGPLCDAVTSGNNGRQMLSKLENDNLFITPLDASQEWYRYHHLFAELLRHQLEAMAGKDRVSELQRKASRWFKDNNFEDEAIEYALAAQDWDSALRLLEKAAHQKEQSGEWATFLKWMEVLPAKAILTHPHVYYEYSKILSASGQSDAAEVILNTLEPIVGQDTRLQGEIAAVRMQIARSRGDTTQAIEYARTALALLPEDVPGERCFVGGILGIIQTMRGHFNEAESLLIGALEDARRIGDHYSAAQSVAWLCSIWHLRGKLHEVFKLSQQTIDWVRQSSAATVFSFLGLIFYEWNDLESALSHLQKADELSQYSRNMEEQEWIYNHLARVLLAKGDIEKAQEIVERIDRLEWAPEILPTFRALTVATHVEIALKRGNLGEAIEWGNKFEESDPISHSLLASFHLLIDRGEKDEATARLKDIYKKIPPDITSGLIGVRVLQAQVAENQEEGIAFLAEALTLGEPEGFIRSFINEGMALAPILRKAISRGIKPEYARKLLRIIETEERQRKIREGEIPASPLANSPLSEREIEVLTLMAEGFSNQEIAAKLIISLNTTKTHLRHIFEKLEVRGRAQAVARAKELELL